MYIGSADDFITYNEFLGASYVRSEERGRIGREKEGELLGT